MRKRSVAPTMAALVLGLLLLPEGSRAQETRILAGVDLELTIGTVRRAGQTQIVLAHIDLQALLANSALRALVIPPDAAGGHMRTIQRCMEHETRLVNGLYPSADVQAILRWMDSASLAAMRGITLALGRGDAESTAEANRLAAQLVSETPQEELEGVELMLGKVAAEFEPAAESELGRMAGKYRAYMQGRAEEMLHRARTELVSGILYTMEPGGSLVDPNGIEPWRVTIVKHERREFSLAWKGGDLLLVRRDVPDVSQLDPTGLGARELFVPREAGPARAPFGAMNAQPVPGIGGR